jgi:hypothetical protein
MLEPVPCVFAGVPHHLLSVIDPSVEFTCRDFRDRALPVSQCCCQPLPLQVPALALVGHMIAKAFPSAHRLYRK